MHIKKEEENNLIRDWFCSASSIKTDELFYAEKQELMGRSWHEAFRDCQEDLGYKARYEDKYQRRNSFIRLLDYFLKTVIVVGIVIIVVILINRIRWTVLVPILAALAFILCWIVRWLYYRRIGFKLFLANERVECYQKKWPSICALVAKTTGRDVPPEPRNTCTADESAMQSFLADAVGLMMAPRTDEPKVTKPDETFKTPAEKKMSEEFWSLAEKKADE